MPDARRDRGIEGAVLSGVVAKDGDIVVGFTNGRLSAGGVVHHLACGVGVGLRIATDVGIGIGALQIALDRIGGQEAANDGIVVASAVVVQARELIGVLAGVAFVGPHGALAVTQVAIGAVFLIAQDGYYFKEK